MGVQGRGPAGVVFPPRGGTVLPVGHSSNYPPPAADPYGGTCRGCGAAVTRAVCPYCGRPATAAQLGTPAVRAADPADPKRAASPRPEYR